MTDAPRCPRHDEPLTLLEEGWLGGVRRTYWGGCPGTTTKRVTCMWHAVMGEWGPSYRCSCSGGVHTPCDREVRVDEQQHEEPSMFGASYDDG